MDSSSSSVSSKAKLDVFLCFERSDTRYNYTSHLYSALIKKNIAAFIDDDPLRRVDNISPVPLKAIEDSIISVIIFSKDFARSCCCLDDLAKVIECRRKNGQIVVPVFYHVEPSHVRNQTGSFCDAFFKHQERFKDMPERLQIWRAALTEAASIFGYRVIENMPEAKFVDEIVEYVWKKLIDKYKYHVFLSFSGMDTRHNFTSHLHSALFRKNILAFIDDGELSIGDEISGALLKAIEDSIISVIIFSKNYAGSSWCLDELVKIIDCKYRKGLIVVPVFYHIEQTDVREQTGRFGKAFADLENRFKETPERVQIWRDALTQAADLPGYHHVTKNRSESKFVDEIVESLLKKLTSKSS